MASASGSNARSGMSRSALVACAFLGLAFVGLGAFVIARDELNAWNAITLVSLGLATAFCYVLARKPSSLWRWTTRGLALVATLSAIPSVIAIALLILTVVVFLLTRRER